MLANHNCKIICIFTLFWIMKYFQCISSVSYKAYFSSRWQNWNTCNLQTEFNDWSLANFSPFSVTVMWSRILEGGSEVLLLWCDIENLHTTVTLPWSPISFFLPGHWGLKVIFSFSKRFQLESWIYLQLYWCWLHFNRKSIHLRFVLNIFSNKTQKNNIQNDKNVLLGEGLLQESDPGTKDK